jgi:DNA-binding PadR family transcriptional regulator
VGDMTGNGKPRLFVFTGREAKLNRAIFQVLAIEGTLTIYEIYNKVRTNKSLRFIKYSVINRRIRNLTDKGYMETVRARRTQAGFQAQLYQLTLRAYLAITLSKIDLDKFIGEANEKNIINALTSLVPLLNED